MKSNLPRDDNGQLSGYAWPGGYPIYYRDRENSVLCVQCAIKSDIEELPQFKPISAGINYEDSSLYCNTCSTRIESAYAEDEVE